MGNNGNGNQSSSYYRSNYTQPAPTLPTHLCFLVIILVMFIVLSWYMNYEAVVESVWDQVKGVVMASPLLLVLVAHYWLSNEEDESRRGLSYYIPMAAEKEWTGGSEWGVGFLVVFLFFHDFLPLLLPSILVSTLLLNQSSIHSSASASASASCRYEPCKHLMFLPYLRCSFKH